MKETCGSDNIVIDFVNDKQVRINGILTDIIDQTGKDLPLLTVTMITFNHCRYLEKAILGVLNQKTDFDFKLLIGDDCSIDGSRDILLKYQKLFPSKIILKLPKSNLGANINSFSNRMLIKSKYICDNEGDDFWIDELKLQDQVEFLEEKTDFNIVAGRNLRMYGDELRVDKIFTPDDNIIDRFDYFKKRAFHISTACYRNPKEYPNWILDIFSSDKFLIFLIAGNKKICVKNKVLSVYRVHEMGISSIKVAQGIKKKRIQGNIRGLNMIKDDFFGHDMEWIKCQLKYLSLIEANMDASLAQKFMILLNNLPFFIRNKNMLNNRMILGFFFK